MRRALSILGGLLVLTGLMVPVVAATEETFTICHVAGLAGTTQFVTLTLPFEAVFGQAGHFNEDGTPQAGHEQDYMGECIVDTSTTTTLAEETTTTLSNETTTTLGEGSTTTLVEVNPICIDCNNATQADLMQLQGVSAQLALDIIANRPYETVQDLVTKGVLTPLQILLILAVNQDTGAFASDACLFAVGDPGGTTTTTLGDDSTTTTLVTTVTTGPTTLPFTGSDNVATGAVAVGLVALGGALLLGAKKWHLPGR